MSGVVVVGQVGRDLVLTVAELPAEGGSADVLERQELLGGKGANQAVACRVDFVRGAAAARNRTQTVTPGW